MLVAELALDAEQSEIVTANKIGIDAGLVLELGDVRGRDSSGGCACGWRKGVAEHRSIERNDAVEILTLRPGNAEVRADVARIVLRSCRRCDGQDRYRCNQIFSHVDL